MDPLSQNALNRIKRCAQRFMTPNNLLESPLESGVSGNEISADARASASGAGNALRSTLPLGVCGSAFKKTKAEGIMYSGNFSLQALRNCSAVGGAHDSDRASSPVGNPPEARDE